MLHINILFSPFLVSKGGSDFDTCKDELLEKQEKEEHKGITTR